MHPYQVRTLARQLCTQCGPLLVEDPPLSAHFRVPRKNDIEMIDEIEKTIEELPFKEHEKTKIRAV